MNLYDYQADAVDTAVYPEEVAFSYLPLKLAGEAGEVAEKIGKLYRKHGVDAPAAIMFDREAIALELGDVLWYVANLADVLGYGLDDIAAMNLEKLKSRKERGVLIGDGDNR